MIKEAIHVHISNHSKLTDALSLPSIMTIAAPIARSNISNIIINFIWRKKVHNTLMLQAKTNYGCCITASLVQQHSFSIIQERSQNASRVSILEEFLLCQYENGQIQVLVSFD